MPQLLFPPRRLRCPWLYVGLLFCLPGCRANLYDARSLPARYAAPPTVDVRSLDLSGLARAKTSSQVLQHGDVMEVTVVTGAVGEVPDQWALRVEPDGAVNVPLVGAVPVAGMSMVGAEQAIRRASIERGVFRQPSVSAILAARRTNRVTVMGAVNTPGTYELPLSSCDLLSVLVAAGGLTEQASPAIEIRHSAQTNPQPFSSPHRIEPGPEALTSYAEPSPPATGPRIELVDLVQASQGQSAGEGPLEDGTIVTVVARPEQSIHVIGLVHRPNRFVLPPGRPIRVLDAIALAGGLSVSIANKVYVIRLPEGADQAIVIQVSLRQAKRSGEENICLMGGDVVSVEETPTTFTVGLLCQFFNFGFSGRVPF